MSENLNRSHPDFSKYDSMSIGELEEILRADAVGPERDDSDVDEILYVMEVLAKKRRQNGIAGKTALEAYQEFQQHYLPKAEEEAQPKHKTKIVPFRRIAAVAASLVLVFSLSITANAFSFKDAWDAVVTWAQETFSFSTGVEVSEPKNESELLCSSLTELLDYYEVNCKTVPLWFPDRYSLSDIIIDETPIQDTYVAIYTSETGMLKISIKSFVDLRPEKIEFSGKLIEKYTVDEVDYYILQNNSILQAAWLSDSFECYIAGELTVEEIKLMIDSIRKG